MGSERELKLKPCPFCGAPAGGPVVIFSECRLFIQCNDVDECGIKGPIQPTIELAIAAWNNRAGEGEDNGRANERNYFGEFQKAKNQVS